MAIFKEAYNTIIDLQKQNEENTKLSEPSPAEEPPSMKVIPQEIKEIKATVAQIQSPKMSRLRRGQKLRGKEYPLPKSE
ncbi:hypothetical protein GcM1_150003 [Golovinomyces cichoracearum]|uniref:Uncharacterized protein n=1 Tax=Golovinomyces cichoracearum TaxID=62708 RepID=A0A420JAV2_9PEZI|nr:hypothetical protein GcM1_150003 [Golovinomyces cichoracearum]